MATVAESGAGRPPISADHRFFLIMAIVMALTIVAGFSTQLATGRSSFHVQIMLHVHAFVFFGWTVFYVLQNALVARGSVALHRRLGWIGAGWAALVTGVGIFTTAMRVRQGGTPFFFEPGFFLIMNSLTALGFGGLIAAGIVMRRRTAWHRRLIFCAMALLSGPAFGRLLPMPLMIPWSAWGVFVGTMLFPIIGVIADLRRSGRVHPGWWCGMATMTAVQLAMTPIAYSDTGVAIYRAVTRGTPGAAVPPLEFPAPPGV